MAKERLPVVVSYTGSRPASFTAVVEFLDEVSVLHVPTGVCA